MSSEVMPASVETERALLGTIFMDPKFYSAASERLRPEDFFLASHRAIFLNMMALDRKHVEIDIVTLGQHMGQTAIAAIGGSAYLASLTEGLPRRPSIKAYVDVIKEKSQGREIVNICGRAMSRVGDQDQESVLSSTIRDLEQVMLGSAAIEDMQTIGQFIVTSDPMALREPGVATGFTRYDEMSYGLHKGELTMVAARTSVGKTSMAGSLAMNLAARGKSVAIILNEQSKRSFFYRLVARKASVPLDRIRRGTYSYVEKQYVDDAVIELKSLPMFWEAGSLITVPQMRTKCSRLIREGEELAVIIIDQLNHIPSDGVVESGNKLRSDEVIGKIVMALKDIAQDLKVPVVLMHQLNRDATKSKSGRPALEHLKGSGSCEEHADNVLLLHRPDDSEDGNAELIVAKARDGATGTCPMRFRADCCSWMDKE